MSIPHTIKTHGLAPLTVLIALLMVGGALQWAAPSRAADSVCGDGDHEAPEQCDDGNLQSGDGCSSACFIELCGNGSIDVSEQCDDGNLQNNDGCNRSCQIEFCGDRAVQETRGEQCDDGNGISGDGCSGSCKQEGVQQETTPPPTPPPPPDPVPSAPPPSQQTLPPVIISEAIALNQFLGSEAGEDYTSYLTDKQAIELETIMKKLAAGRRLTKEEREWALELYGALQKAKFSERTRYTDLLKQFIATPISSEVVEEKDLNKSFLVDVEVPVAITELKRAVEIIRRGELKSAVVVDVARLKRQGIDLSEDIPAGYEKNFDAGNQPISVFATLKTLKEAAEKYATTDVPASLELVRSEALSLKLALPLLEQEYGLDPSITEPLLTAIENVSKEATKQDVDRVVAAINRFFASLERNTILSKADIATFEQNPAHTAAAATRIADVVGLRDQLTTMDTITPFLSDLSAAAPTEAKDSFERGTVQEQRRALLDFLANDDRVTSLRMTLREDGRTEFDARYEELTSDIAYTGDLRDTVTLCDDTMPEALQCAHQYLIDLEQAVRGRNFFTRLIGHLQDYFDIGS